MSKYILVLFTVLIASSCVSKKNFEALQLEREQMQKDYNNTALEFDAYRKQCEEDKLALQKQESENSERIKYLQERIDERENTIGERDQRYKDLQAELDYLKKTNTNLLDRLSDLSIVSKEGAVSIKKSLETVNRQSSYINEMTKSIQRKDSTNLVLIMNLKRSLADINDQDVNIEVKKGVVYVSLSDKLLFNSGSSNVKPSAEVVLGKIAAVVNDHRELDILIEGHTDDDPIATSCIQDNWDLSVKRATSVARVLQRKYNVEPSRMTAGGRSEYIPKMDNASDYGKSINRRTEIIILPKLDQFFELMTIPE